MFGLLIAFHVLVCILLILTVLLQLGKGAGLANIFGGGPSGVFGASTSAFFARLTSGLAIIFMLTSLYLSLIAHEKFLESKLKKALQKEAPLKK
ncbi:MAG TPA: preprotein translocase subunit SecG [bacterium]|nr:preprotein translocase subunit SecG [bacterium]HEX67769.1 preprotein translocase subunit SecG [bacterium]